MKHLRNYLFILLALLAMGSPVISQDIQDLIHSCAVSAGDDVTYLKDFVVKLDETPVGGKSPVFRQSLALRKNVTYRFTICNLETSKGEAVLRLYDEAKLILSSYYPDTGKEYSNVNFACKKSGIYTIIISFKEGKAGEAISVLSYVNK